MKKIVLSTLTALSIATVASAADVKLYQDANGQVFTSAAEGRTELNIQPETKKKNSITIVDQNSPDFLLGKETHINMKFVADDNPDMWLKAGVRVQGTFQDQKTDYKATDTATKFDKEVSDAYLRRVRFEVSAGFNKYTSFVMDVRNDKANYQDVGEESFNVGDAYVQIKKPFDTSLVNFKLYRAKIDVSRTETIKSAHTLHYDRPTVADEAAQFITHNRRGTNAQMFGDWNKKVHYQVAFGDGTYSGAFSDATGAKLAKSTFEQSSFFYGGKVLLSPFDGWEEKEKTETYFGEGQHFSIGAAYWNSPDISYKSTSTGAATTKINHELINFEISAHYKGLMAQAEYFHFNGVVKNFAVAGQGELGSSNGWYATSEYVFKDLSYIAPFVRYESWNKYNDQAGYDFTSKIAGLNWYLKGNSIKAGIAYQQDEYGSKLKDGERTVSTLKLTSQFFF